MQDTDALEDQVSDVTWGEYAPCISSALAKLSVTTAMEYQERMMCSVKAFLMHIRIQF
jgi:hypothetical protein